MKLLQQALTVLPQLEKLHDVSAVRRTRNTSKETMSLQCVIQKTLTHRCMQLHFTKLLQQALFVLSKRAVSATLYIWWHACYNLSLSLSRTLRNPRRGENILRKLTSFIADELSQCCCFSSSRQVHCCCHLLLSKITVCTQPKLQEASNWNSPCYQALHTRGSHARMISLCFDACGCVGLFL